MLGTAQKGKHGKQPNVYAGSRDFLKGNRLGHVSLPEMRNPQYPRHCFRCFLFGAGMGHEN